jgi:hypothetical protein
MAGPRVAGDEVIGIEGRRNMKAQSQMVAVDCRTRKLSGLYTLVTLGQIAAT